MKINTAYYIAKEELSFIQMKPLILLQKKKGLCISPTYDNDVRCAELISNNAADSQDMDTNKVKESNGASVMIDGATDSSVTENEAIYVRYLHDGLPVNHFAHVSVRAATCSC